MVNGLCRMSIRSRAVSRNVVWGWGDCFCGERKYEKISKKQTKYVFVWGDLKFRGEYFPLKTLKRITDWESRRKPFRTLILMTIVTAWEALEVAGEERNLHRCMLAAH